MKVVANLFDIRKFNNQQRSHFYINVGVGLTIAFIFFLMGQTDWGEQLVNLGFDILVRIESRIYREKTVPLNGSPVFFIDITHADYKKWGEPLVTPRDRLARMIENSWQQGAAVVALDVQLDRPDRANPAGDRQLRTVLERMLRENAGTHVIFPVAIGVDGDIKNNIFDDLIDLPTAKGVHIFHRAVPAIEATTRDMVYRYWVPSNIGSKGGRPPQLIWSVTVLATALSEGKAAELDLMARELLSKALHGHGHVHTDYAIRLGGREVEIAPLVRNTAVRDNPREPLIVQPEAHSRIYTQRIRFRLAPETASTARLRLTGDKFEPGDDNLLPYLAGKIVLIGNLSPDLNDLHMTPVGKMPGVYILGNAINTVADGRMPVHFPLWGHVMAEIVVILVAAIFFLHFTSQLAQFMASSLFIAIFFPVSWIIYDSWGLFFNFIVPLIGMSFHRIASGFEDALISRGRRTHH